MSLSIHIYIYIDYICTGVTNGARCSVLYIPDGHPRTHAQGHTYGAGAGWAVYVRIYIHRYFVLYIHPTDTHAQGHTYGTVWVVCVCVVYTMMWAFVSAVLRLLYRYG